MECKVKAIGDGLNMKLNRIPACYPVLGRKTCSVNGCEETADPFRKRWLGILTILLVSLTFSPDSLSTTNDLLPATRFCSGDRGEQPHLVMETASGTIEIRLFEDAAPAAVQRMIEAIQGPIFNTLIFGEQDVGYYDGLAIDYTRPRIEVRVTERRPSGLIELPTQIDADALGLDDARITDIDDAVDVMQFQLIKAYNETKQGGERSVVLNQWLDQWFEKKDASFLIGESRKKINESLGYVYQTGLASRPMLKGAVALKPISPDTASMTLSILLADADERTGKWMVVGEVVRGLDIVEEISIQPLREPAHVRSRTYVPFEPLVIRSARVRCVS
jgi:cyclophilin family peptidyl-prolyl cis-trans isomerase